MKKNQKNSQFMALLFVALALFIGIFLVTKPTKYESKAGQAAPQTYTKIQSNDDLDRALRSLEETDLESMEVVVNQNEEELED
jgi:predicted transcriptional regulator